MTSVIMLSPMKATLLNPLDRMLLMVACAAIIVFGRPAFADDPSAVDVDDRADPLSLYVQAQCSSILTQMYLSPVYDEANRFATSWSDDAITLSEAFETQGLYMCQYSAASHFYNTVQIDRYSDADRYYIDQAFAFHADLYQIGEEGLRHKLSAFHQQYEATPLGDAVLSHAIPAWNQHVNQDAMEASFLDAAKRIQEQTLIKLKGARD